MQNEEWRSKGEVSEMFSHLSPRVNSLIFLSGFPDGPPRWALSFSERQRANTYQECSFATPRARRLCTR